MIQDTGITDLTPLHGMPLQHIHLTPKSMALGLDIGVPIAAEKKTRMANLTGDSGAPIP